MANKTVEQQTQEQLILVLEKLCEITNDGKTILDMMKRIYIDALVSGGDE